MRYDRSDLQGALAARWAAGTMAPRARRRLQHLAATRPALRAHLAAWQGHAATLAAAVPPRDASPALWQAIARRIGTPAPRESTRPSWAWLRPALAGLALGGLAVVAAVRLAPQRFTDVESLAQAQQALPHSYIGILAGADGKTLAWLGSTRQGRRLFVKLANAVPLAAGEALELRALAPGQAPRVLGPLAPAKGLSELALPDNAEALFKPVDTLQIVARRADGSEREVARGPCAKIW